MSESFSVISDAVGFALMKMPAVLNSSYERSPCAQRTQEGLQLLRTTLKTVNPANYRGVARCPLSEYALPDPGWAGATEEIRTTREVDKEAINRLLQILGPEHQCESYPCCLVPTREHAQELMSLVDAPDVYEIVRLSKALPESRSSTASDLGFDVGYWGGGNFSILCDSAIWPVWHGPYGDVFDQLSKLLVNLNHHCLFPDYSSAERFRSYYRTQDWAEKEGEPGEFCIMKVETIAPLAS